MKSILTDYINDDKIPFDLKTKIGQLEEEKDNLEYLLKIERRKWEMERDKADRLEEEVTSIKEGYKVLLRFLKANHSMTKEGEKVIFHAGPKKPY